MRILAFAVFCAILLFIGCFVWTLCKVAAKADDMSESWEKARREQIEKDK